jgi:hypothetical protein
MKNPRKDQNLLPEDVARYYQRVMEAGRLSGAEGELELARMD